MFFLKTEVIDLSEEELKEYAKNVSVSIPKEVFIDHLTKILSNVSNLLNLFPKNKTGFKSYWVDIAFSFMPMLTPMIVNYMKNNNMSSMYVEIALTIKNFDSTKKMPYIIVRVGDETEIKKLMKTVIEIKLK